MRGFMDLAEKGLGHLGGMLDHQFRWRCIRPGGVIVRLRIVLLILNTIDLVLWDAPQQDLVFVNLCYFPPSNFH